MTGGKNTQNAQENKLYQIKQKVKVTQMLI